MRTPRPITAAPIAVALAGVVLASLAGCGATSGTAATGTSGAATGDGGRPAPASAGATTPPAAHLGGDVTFRTTLSTRVETGDGQVTTLDAAGPYRSGAHPAADLTRTGGGQAAPRELRLVGGALYVRSGAVMRPGGGGKPWTRVTRTAATLPLARTLAAVERGSPAALLRMIGTSHDVRWSGPSHCAGTFAGPAGVRSLAAADRWPARELSAFRTLRFDVTVDSAGRPTRIKLTGSAGDRHYTLTQTFAQYGLPVRVTAPPSRQVGDGDGPVLPHAPRMAQ